MYPAAPSSASSASPSDGGSDQGGGKDSAGTGSDENDEVGTCRTDELEITAADRTIDGEGTVAVTLKNGGGRDCAISGHAGVDLKTSAGALSAKRSGEPADPHILKDGESTYFGVTYPMNEPHGSGVRVTGLVVTPPNETKPVTLDWPGAATLPVTDGAGSPVKVGPIGGIGQGG